MKSNQFIRKIKHYSLISFFLPLLSINICLFVFQILGNNDIYIKSNWSKKEFTPQEYLADRPNAGVIAALPGFNGPSSLAAFSSSLPAAL